MSVKYDLTEFEKRTIRNLSPRRRREYAAERDAMAYSVDSGGDPCAASSYYRALAAYARSLDDPAKLRFNVEVIETYEVAVDLPHGMSADPAEWSEADKLHLYGLIDDAMTDMPAFDGVTHRYPLDADGNPGEEI